jgi:dTDP-4-amino-4,6-dideoxygalactose transaminase
MKAIPRQRIAWPARTWRRTLACAASGTLWEGPAIERFERKMAALLSIPHTLAVPSGRVGLALVLDALNLTPGAEVICPAFGYPGVPFVVEAAGFRVRFVDCELTTFGIDPAALAQALSPRTGAVIAAHLFGVPCRIREIAAMTRDRNVPLIEDCAHVLCASVGRQPVGTFGVASYFSFETSKLVNTLGGGMIATRDASLAETVRARLSAQPRNGSRWLAQRLVQTSLEAVATRRVPFELLGRPLLQVAQRLQHTEFASGYKPDEYSFQGRRGQYTNLQAELGCDEFERALGTLERRRANAARLHDELGSTIHFQQPADVDTSADYLLCTALVPDLTRAVRRLLDLGVDTKHHYMSDCARLFAEGRHPCAAQAEREVLHVPAYPELAPAEIERVVGALASVAGELGPGPIPASRPRRERVLADVG